MFCQVAIGIALPSTSERKTSQICCQGLAETSSTSLEASFGLLLSFWRLGLFSPFLRPLGYQERMYPTPYPHVCLLELLLQMRCEYLLGIFIKRRSFEASTELLRSFHSRPTVDYYCAIQDFAVKSWCIISKFIVQIITYNNLLQNILLILSLTPKRHVAS